MLALVLLVGVGPASVGAAPQRGFGVTVNLFTEPKTAVCERSAAEGSGSQVRVVCGTTQPSETSRHLLHVFRSREWIGSVDGEMSTGTVTSWRVVHLANREYLEMTVGW
jgi:hypothetical protein